MCDRQEDFTNANTRVVIISFATLPALQQWMEETCSAFEVLIDQDRTVYRAFQLERSVRRAWHPRAIWVYIKRWFNGEKFYDSHGDDTSQLGGDFIIDKTGKFQLVYPSRDPTDRPDVEALLAIIKGLN